MKTNSSSSFKNILRRLAQQDPEEKLRISFQLNEFVNKLYTEGRIYNKTNQRLRTRATA